MCHHFNVQHSLAPLAVTHTVRAFLWSIHAHMHLRWLFKVQHSSCRVPHTMHAQGMGSDMNERRTSYGQMIWIFDHLPLTPYPTTRHSEYDPSQTRQCSRMSMTEHAFSLTFRISRKDLRIQSFISYVVYKECVNVL